MEVGGGRCEGMRCVGGVGGEGMGGGYVEGCGGGRDGG